MKAYFLLALRRRVYFAVLRVRQESLNLKIASSMKPLSRRFWLRFGLVSGAGLFHIQMLSQNLSEHLWKRLKGTLRNGGKIKIFENCRLMCQQLAVNLKSGLG